MPANFNVQARSRGSWAVATALLLVYVVWGTTYFATSIALQTMPPLLMNAVRFLCAGVVMLLIALWQGHALPTALQWRNSALVGGLMVFLAMNFIGFAQKLGIGSGLMATVVTTMPMWLALWTRWGGERVPLTSWIGLGLGVVGALLLAMEGDFSATWVGALLALGILCSGVAYILYFRLIERAGPARALTVTYLIPVFAVAYGVLLLGESVTAWMLMCGVVVLAGTALASGLVRLPGLARAASRS